MGIMIVTVVVVVVVFFFRVIRTKGEHSVAAAGPSTSPPYLPKGRPCMLVDCY
jgi:hypothetical protein